MKVKKHLKESKTPKGELEDALYNVKGILHAYNDTEYGITKEDFNKLYATISDIIDKLSRSYDYGPYEGEPYHFGY